MSYLQRLAIALVIFVIVVASVFHFFGVPLLWSIIGAVILPVLCFVGAWYFGAKTGR